MPTNKPCSQCDKMYFPLRRGLCHNCYMKARNRFGGFTSSYVDAFPVREHIVWLLSCDLNVHQIAIAAGIGDATIYYILRGRPARNIPPARKVAGKTATAILSVKAKEFA